MARRADTNETGLSPSLEDYLERVFRLQKIHSRASCSEIAVLMGVNLTSVTGALRSLSELGLVNYRPYGKVTLTEKGTRVAEDVAVRHAALREFLSQLLLFPVADADSIACGMEHAMTREAAIRLNGFISYIAPRMPKDWGKSFTRYLDAWRDAASRRTGRKTPLKKRRTEKMADEVCA
jgi:DtxR family Mn-dependent transcriptional regulator